MLTIHTQGYTCLGKQLFCAALFVLCIFVCLFLIYSGTTHASEDKLDQETSVYSALSMGTGWALTHRHVVTNYHVVDGMKNLRLVLNGNKEVPVEIVLADKKNDLAVLFIKDESVLINPLPLALTKPRLGTRVFTVGYPHPNLMGTSPKLTSGLINATNGLADDPRTLQVSVPVQSGNSGGPLLNMRGEVVGIITSKLSAQKMFEWTGDIPQNVNYAIKINQLSSLISELETDEKVMAGGASKNQSLEVLAENIIDSVIIVAGDGNKQEIASRHVFFSSDRQKKPVSKEQKRKIIVYSYAEPGYYDYDDNIEGSYTVHKYSKNTVNVLTQQLKKHLGSNMEFVIKGGESIKKIFYQLEKTRYSKSLCTKNKASHIIASYSEGEQGHVRHFRLVTYRMIDCDTQKAYKKEYYIERDDLNDRFGFEVALHTTFKDFLLKTPPYISWASR